MTAISYSLRILVCTLYALRCVTTFMNKLADRVYMFVVRRVRKNGYGSVVPVYRQPTDAYHKPALEYNTTPSIRDVRQNLSWVLQDVRSALSYTQKEAHLIDRALETAVRNHKRDYSSILCGGGKQVPTRTLQYDWLRSKKGSQDRLIHDVETNPGPCAYTDCNYEGDDPNHLLDHGWTPEWVQENGQSLMHIFRDSPDLFTTSERIYFRYSLIITLLCLPYMYASLKCLMFPVMTQNSDNVVELYLNLSFVMFTVTVVHIGYLVFIVYNSGFKKLPQLLLLIIGLYGWFMTKLTCRGGIILRGAAILCHMTFYYYNIRAFAAILLVIHSAYGIKTVLYMLFTVVGYHYDFIKFIEDTAVGI